MQSKNSFVLHLKNLMVNIKPVKVLSNYLDKFRLTLDGLQGQLLTRVVGNVNSYLTVQGLNSGYVTSTHMCGLPFNLNGLLFVCGLPI